MNTLLEFLTFTKGTSYLIAIAFLIGFIAFWQMLYPKGKKLGLRIITLVILSIGLAGLAAYSIVQQPGTAPAPEEKEMPFINPAILVEMYGPALFDHDMHIEFSECTVCHHESGDETPPCQECHADPFDPSDLRKPGLERVYHLRCISCHKEEQVGPTECTGCHHKAAIPPLSVVHPLTGVENCFKCHKGEMSGVPGMPSDHAGVNNGQCRLCHKTVVDEAELAKRELPHEVDGNQDCLICHGEGIAGATRVPEDHAGRTNETCLLCHRSS
jgi:hypothetical protein